MSKIINMVWSGVLVATVIGAVTAYAEEVGLAKIPASGQHCIYDVVPLEGTWEMAYRSNAWDSVECPKLQGITVDKAVPGFWEDMVPALRAAGMKDAVVRV